jgi:UTP--glucose-1-phosphate uridylyltransferase
MLPVAGKPLIQFAVEEAAASGLDTVILVIGRGKSLLSEHFRRDPALENILREKGNGESSELIRRLSQLADIRTVWQDVPLGLAHAIGCARSEIGDEPFAVILPDAVIDATVPCTQQLMACHAKHGGCVVATQRVAATEVDRFGILGAQTMPDPCCGGRTLHVTSLTERPAVGSTNSNHGIFGRYILEPEIFSCIDQTRPGLAGELQLTDSLLLGAGRMPLFAYRFDGAHYDAGSKLGFLRATLAYALKDPETARLVREQVSQSQPAQSTLSC